MILFISILLGSPLYSSIIVFVSQILFIYLRTINIIYTNDRKLFLSTLTGIAIGFTYLISTAFSLNSILTGDIYTILAFIIGGVIGNIWGILQEKKKTKI